jgi:SAM-dependent methyltransferase
MTSGAAPIEPQTWHFGVVARWWAAFNLDGPEIAFFQRYVEDGGGPALDVACGTGRLLIPYLHAGLDVDGCDISGDMLALCRERAEREGLVPRLYRQAMHELDVPRRYRTIVLCGGFGLGGNRDHDVEALRRLYRHLEPGGLLLLDNEVPYNDAKAWRCFLPEERAALPDPLTVQGGSRRRAADGTEYELRLRVLALDPLAQRITYAIDASVWRDGELVEREERVLQMTLYLTNEVRLMLEAAGFEGIELRGDYTEAEPTADTGFVVFVARKPR